MTLFDDRSEPEVYKNPADPTDQFARVLSHFMDKRLQRTFSGIMSVEALGECLKQTQEFITERGGLVPGVDKKEPDSNGFTVDGYCRHYREFSITDNLATITRAGVIVEAAEEISILFAAVVCGWDIQADKAVVRLIVNNGNSVTELVNACDVFVEMLNKMGMSLEVTK